jgi:hypothetical protein
VAFIEYWAENNDYGFVFFWFDPVSHFPYYLHEQYWQKSDFDGPEYYHPELDWTPIG